MSHPAQFSSLATAKLPAGPLHLAIGMFDGVHLGHRAVIDAAVANAGRTGGVAAVLTFWPHPSALFRPENRTRMIQDVPTKVRVLGQLGMTAVIVEPFTRELAAIVAEEFLPWLEERLPALAAVYVGENFRFGAKRLGDAKLLTESGRQLGVTVITAPRVLLHGERVSSTRIRSLLETGEIEKANELLGCPYFSEGVITPGKKLGRTLGFPTLNIPWAPDLRPRFGVYAVRVSAESGEPSRPGVANYGLRPTVENTTEPKLEVHVLGDCPFDAGDDVVVEWLRFLRPEAKFANLDALRAQIAQDRDTAAKYFGL